MMLSGFTRAHGRTAAREGPVDEEQVRRVALNEARFREMNDRQVGGVATFHGSEAPFQLHVMCECAVSECSETIELDAGAYRHVRSNPRWFVVRPDHVLPQVETRVEEHGAYWIVEKHQGTGARVAEETA